MDVFRQDFQYKLDLLSKLSLDKLLERLDLYFFLISEQISLKRETTIDDFILGEPIDSTSTYSTYIGKYIPTDETVTIKIIIKTTQNEDDIKFNSVLSEKLRNHINITNYRFILNLDSQYVFVSDYINDGQLLIHHKINKHKLIDLLDIAYQLSDGLSFIHSKGIVHRNINTNSIIMKGLVPFIIDFEFACSGDSEMINCNYLEGSDKIFYMAPECSEREYDKYKADIFSLGVVFFFIFNNKKIPFRNVRILEFTSNSGNSKLDKIIMLMINFNPIYRPSLDNIKDNIQRMIKSI